MMSKEISNLDKEELLKLIEIYAKNWLAMDGVWFQSIEDKFGMQEAIEHDENAWRRFTVIEANRIKEFLKLPEQAGLKGLAKALKYRMYANINEDAGAECPKKKRNGVPSLQIGRYNRIQPFRQDNRQSD